MLQNHEIFLKRNLIFPVSIDFHSSQQSKNKIEYSIDFQEQLKLTLGSQDIKQINALIDYIQQDFKNYKSSKRKLFDEKVKKDF